MKRTHPPSHRANNHRHHKRTPATLPSASLLRQFVSALPVLVGVSVLSLLLIAFGLLRPAEIGILDVWMGIEAAREHAPTNIAIVTITASDYRVLFNAKSPLDPLELGRIVGAIASAKSEVIGVDIDTSDTTFSNLAPEPDWPPVVWAQAATPGEGAIFDVQPILGGKGKGLSGAAILQLTDGEVRTYFRQILTDRGVVDSFSTAVAKAYSQGTVETETALADTKQYERLLDFREMPSARYKFETFTASEVLRGAQGPAWRSNGIFENRIVLLGGSYDPRDRYHTPIGMLSGCELLAEAIETELRGGSVRPPTTTLLFLLNMLLGVGLLLVYHELGFRSGVAINITCIFLVPLLFSLATFSSTRYWAIFVPMPVAFLIQHLYSSGKNHRNDILAALYRQFRLKI